MTLRISNHLLVLWIHSYSSSLLFITSQLHSFSIAAIIPTYNITLQIYTKEQNILCTLLCTRKAKSNLHSAFGTHLFLIVNIISICNIGTHRITSTESTNRFFFSPKLEPFFLMFLNTGRTRKYYKRISVSKNRLLYDLPIHSLLAFTLGPEQTL